MTPSGIEPATFQFEVQHLNHCATAVPFLVRVCIECKVTLKRYILQRLDFLLY